MAGDADRAWELLADGLTPQQAVAMLTPSTREEAVALARKLPLLHERPEADRGAAVARLAARAGMKRFRLAFAADGRVAAADERPALNQPTRTFPGDGCTVTYTARCYPDRDHFSFVGHGTPPAPHPLSPTGHWSHFTPADAVAAMGGPEAYAAALASAGRDADFAAAFEGAGPEATRPKRRAVGPQTARLVPPARPFVPPSPPAVTPSPEPPLEPPPPGRLF